MRKLLLVLAIAAVGFAGTLAAETKTVKGEVVDVQCKMKKAENVGEKHESCAMACAKRGAAMGILTTEGDVYTIVGDYTADKNAKLLEFVAKTVQATGEVVDKDGQKQLKVTEIKLEKSSTN